MHWEYAQCKRPIVDCSSHPSGGDGAGGAVKRRNGIIWQLWRWRGRRSATGREAGTMEVVKEGGATKGGDHSEEVKIIHRTHR